MEIKEIIKTKKLSAKDLKIKNFTFSQGLGNYFTISTVSPEIDDGTLWISNHSDGYKYSNVRSTVIRYKNIIKVEVIGWPKKMKRPVKGNFYFLPENNRWVRRTANYKTIKKALKKSDFTELIVISEEDLRQQLGKYLGLVPKTDKEIKKMLKSAKNGWINSKDLDRIETIHLLFRGLV